jgi:hypothetical protein
MSPVTALESCEIKTPTPHEVARYSIQNPHRTKVARYSEIPHCTELRAIKSAIFKISTVQNERINLYLNDDIDPQELPFLNQRNSEVSNSAQSVAVY